MRFIRVPNAGINIENLYVKVTCLSCEREYSIHLRRAEQFRTCPCGMATFDFSLKQYGRWLGIAVVWTGRIEDRPEMIKEINVNAIEIAQKEIPWVEEIEEEGEQ